MPNVSGGELAHVDGAGMSRAVILTRAEMADHSKAVVAQNPKRFSWFVSTDVTKPDAIQVLRSHLTAGAIGWAKRAPAADAIARRCRKSMRWRRRPEDRARDKIDQLLREAGWQLQYRDNVNIDAGWGIAIREFQLAPGYGCADYLLYVDGYAAGIVEAKKEGVTLTEVENQTDRYGSGLPAGLPAPRRPLPFRYQSTGTVTRWTNFLEPDVRSRPMFGFHRPETLAAWMVADLKSPGSGLRNRLRVMPPLSREGLWEQQYKVIDAQNPARGSNATAYFSVVSGFWSTSGGGRAMWRPRAPHA